MAGRQYRKVESIEGEEVGGYTTEVDGGYNPADFIIPGSDHQGHHERVFCRVQPQHERAIGLIFKSKKFPFRTEGDLIRWCVVRGIKVLDRLDPHPGLLGAVDAISEILRNEQYLQEMSAMFAKMETVMAAHISAGATGEARRLLTVILGQIRAIEEPFWKKQCEENVMKRFGHLLEGRAGK